MLVQFIYQLQNVGSSHYESLPDVGSQSQEIDESASEPKHSHHHRHYHRAGHRHKKSYERDRDHDHDHDHDHDYRNRGTESEEGSDECDCSCNKCDRPSDCCKNACKSCPSPYGGGYDQSQSSVVFVPYPYPMIVPNTMMKNDFPHGPHLPQPTIPPTTTTTTTSTTTTTTTTSTTTTTETPLQNLFLKSQDNDNKVFLKAQNDNSMLESVLKSVVDDYSNLIVKTPEKLKNGNNKYMLTSLRRTKPTWMPKFGVVPISDNIAAKLMSQLRASRGPLRRQI